MATLAAEKPRPIELGTINELPVVADDIIYEGAAVGESGTTGYVRPLVAADAFVGFAERTADNAGGAAGAARVRLRTRGLVQLPIASLAITDLGANVYASDDDTFTLTSEGNSLIGTVHRWVETGVGVVKFDV